MHTVHGERSLASASSWAVSGNCLGTWFGLKPCPGTFYKCSNSSDALKHSGGLFLRWTAQTWPQYPAQYKPYSGTTLQDQAIKECLVISNHEKNRTVWILGLNPKALFIVTVSISIFCSWIIMISKFQKAEPLQTSDFLRNKLWTFPCNHIYLFIYLLLLISFIKSHKNILKCIRIWECLQWTMNNW